MMVEIFKTNVEMNQQAKDLVEQLCLCFPEYKTNFDLDDCDKILRVEGAEVEIEKIIKALNKEGYECVVLL